MAKTKIQSKLSYLKRRSIKHGLNFDLDKEWLTRKLDITTCEATGVNLSIDNDTTTNPNHPSIDRVDSTKGYTKDNCKVVSRIYNVAKGDQSEEVLVEWAKLFVEKYENEIMLEKHM